MATGTIKDGLKLTTLVENATAVKYNEGDTIIESGVNNYKYLIVTYVYSLTGNEYLRLIDTQITRPYILDTVLENVMSSLNLHPVHGWLKLLTNGSVSGVFIKKIVGVN